jgi:hypothetical protein
LFRVLKISIKIGILYPIKPGKRVDYGRDTILGHSSFERENMVHWEHLYLLGTMVFTVAGDVVRDFDDEYDAWNWLEKDGWGLVAIEPPDPVRPGACKYYFKRQRAQISTRAPITAAQPAVITTHPVRRERQR